MNYATVDDLEKRWKKLTEAEKEKAEVLIAEASSKIRIQARREGKDFDGIYLYDEDIREITIGLVCNVVKGAMAIRSDAIGVTQYSASVGGYNESMSFSNPTGGVRISKKDYHSIGLNTQKYGGIDVYGMDRKTRSDGFSSC